MPALPALRATDPGSVRSAVPVPPSAGTRAGGPLPRGRDARDLVGTQAGISVDAEVGLPLHRSDGSSQRAPRMQRGDQTVPGAAIRTEYRYAQDQAGNP